MKPIEIKIRDEADEYVEEESFEVQTRVIVEGSYGPEIQVFNQHGQLLYMVALDYFSNKLQVLIYDARMSSEPNTITLTESVREDFEKLIPKDKLHFQDVS